MIDLFDVLKHICYKKKINYNDEFEKKISKFIINKFLSSIDEYLLYLAGLELISKPLSIKEYVYLLYKVLPSTRKRFRYPRKQNIKPIKTENLEILQFMDELKKLGYSQSSIYYYVNMIYTPKEIKQKMKKKRRRKKNG